MSTMLKFRTLLILWVSLLLAACSKNIFRSQSTPHGRYKEGLIQAGLQHTAMGSQWISAGESSLQRPVRINIPYKENGYFAPDRPVSFSYIFSLKRGDKFKLIASTNPATGIKLFIELWEPGKITSNDKPLEIIDSANNTLQFVSEKDGDHILRLQPELLKGIEYTITLTTEPSLAYPVQSSGKPRLISPWGVGRDGGTRSHEGIDIGAAFRTPALAVADGNITRVGDNKLGGKVVFMRPAGQDYSVYYAHLDSQTVQAGQRVNAGEVVGLVGNTGNAQNTVPHLHFGIYTNDGAVDPLPFVNKDRAQPKNISGNKNNFNTWMRIQKNTTLDPAPANDRQGIQLKTGEALMIISANATQYRVLMPGGREGFIDHTAVTASTLRKQKFPAEKRLLDAPYATAPAITTVAANSEVEVKGVFTDFLLVKYKDSQGWISAGE